jgi:hypothetical protein
VLLPFFFFFSSISLRSLGLGGTHAHGLRALVLFYTFLFFSFDDTRLQ